MRNSTYDETPDVRFEDSWFSRVLEPHKAEIAEIKESYKLLLSIVELFKQTFPLIDQKLSTYYIDLFAIIESNIKEIEDKIYDRYDANANNGKGLPADFIHTDVYSGFYKPFLNLYVGKTEIQNDKSNWEEIQRSMNEYYAQVNGVYHKYGLKGVKQLPHQELLNEVSTYLKSKGQLLEMTTKSKFNLYSLHLNLRGDHLFITGTALKHKAVTLQKLRKSTSSLLLELTIRSCANKATEFKSITKELLESKSRFDPKELEEAVKKIELFKKYISSVGLQRELKTCFYGNSNSGLGYKFRTAVSESEWNDFTQDTQSAILQELVNMPQKKA